MKFSVVGILSVIFGLLVILLGLLLWRSVEAPRVIGLQSVSMAGIGPMTADCEVRVYSPNLFTISCRSLDLAFRYEGKKFASGNIIAPTDLQSEAESVFPMRLTFDGGLTDIPLGDFLLNDSIPVTIDWSSRLSFLNLRYSGSTVVNISRSDLLPEFLGDMGRSLDLGFEKVSLKSAGFEETVLVAELRMRNIVNMPMEVSEALMYIFQDEAMTDTLSRVNQQAGINLPPGGSVGIPVELKIKNLQAARWGTDMITRDYLDCYLSSGNVGLSVSSRRFLFPIGRSRLRIYPFSGKIEMKES